MLGSVTGRDGQRLFPILPVFILEEEGDGRSDGLTVADPGEDVGRILLDLHASAAAVALLAAPELAIDEFLVEIEPGGNAGEGCNQGFAMGFAGGGETQHALAL